MSESLYPECDKLVKVAPESQKIGDFIDWLNEQGIHLCKWCRDRDIVDHEQLIYLSENIEHLLARYFEIDLDKVEKEKRALLETIRNQK